MRRPWVGSSGHGKLNWAIIAGRIRVRQGHSRFPYSLLTVRFRCSRRRGDPPEPKRCVLLGCVRLSTLYVLIALPLRLNMHGGSVPLVRPSSRRERQDPAQVNHRIRLVV